MSRISVFELSFQAWVLHEFRRQILIAIFHQGTEVINHDLKFKMLCCSHSFHMFFSKRKSRLTRKPSLRPDVLSRYRCKTCKCYALTILSIKCRINLRKKIQPQSTTKLLTRYRWKCKTLRWQTIFIPYTLASAPPLSPSPPSPPSSPLPQCFSVSFDSRQMGSFSISMLKTSRKVTAWHLFRSKSQIT